jgi:hypothetical protein
MSKLSAAEWATEDVAIPGLATMDDDQAYRAMDMLVEADTQGQGHCCIWRPLKPASSTRVPERHRRCQD